MWNAHDIDAALRDLRIASRLGKVFEDEYDRRQEKSARSQIVLVLTVSLVLSILGLLSDANAGILGEALFWKLWVQVPALLLAIWAALRLPLSPDRIWLIGAIPFVLTVAVVTTLAVETVAPITDRYATIAGLTAFAANIALPMKFRNALMLTAANVAVFVGIPFALMSFARVEPFLDILLFMSLIALATTALVRNRERTQKRAFLLTLANESHTVDLQSLVNELTELAYRDALTGAGNRRGFDMRYQAAWRAAATHGEQIALILIDVDHFKLFNDAAGHAEGDICLRKVAQAIAKGAGCSIDAVARYGGEEFALVLQSSTGNIAEAIRSSVAALALPHPGLPKGSIVTVSIGKAIAFPSIGLADPDDLVRAADDALYEAKKTGRNRVVLKGFAQFMAA
jgi:diguanylate cyclase (GGDEF)-like protein